MGCKVVNQPQWDISTAALEEDVHFSPCFHVKRREITPDNEIPNLKIFQI